jgi:REP element-mobilizing transposase RayT
MSEPNRPVLAYHLIISAYGFWLPNDPRGSWSWIVRNPNLRVFGEATKVETHRSVAGRPHDRAKRLAAKASLKYPPVRFDGLQAKAIGTGFGKYVEKSGLTVWACAIMPDHAHLVIARHRYDIEAIGNLAKGEATKQLRAENRHPFEAFQKRDGTVPPCFGRKWWSVFIDDEDHIEQSIRYVEKNPVKAGFKSQARMWPFVVPYPTRYEDRFPA